MSWSNANLIEKKVKHPCVMCQKAVRQNGKAVSCDDSRKWIHIRCADIFEGVYNDKVKSGEDFLFLCDRSASGTFMDTNYANPMKQLATPMYLLLCVLIEFCDLAWHFFQEKRTHISAKSDLLKLYEARVLAAHSKAAVIVVTETWFDQSVTDAEAELPGHHIVRHDQSRTRGKVCMYSCQDLSFNPRPDLL